MKILLTVPLLYSLMACKSIEASNSNINQQAIEQKSTPQVKKARTKGRYAHQNTSIKDYYKMKGQITSFYIQKNYRSKMPPTTTPRVTVDELSINSILSEKLIFGLLPKGMMVTPMAMDTIVLINENGIEYRLVDHTMRRICYQDEKGNYIYLIDKLRSLVKS